MIALTESWKDVRVNSKGEFLPTVNKPWNVYPCNVHVFQMSYFAYSKVKVNGKVLPVHVMKTFRESRGKVPLILNLRTTWSWVANFTPRPFYPREGNPVPTGWTAEPMWTVWSKERFLVSTRIRTPDHPARRLPHTASVGGKMFCKVVHITCV